jgi:hypothetical protein
MGIPQKSHSINYFHGACHVFSINSQHNLCNFILNMGGKFVKLFEKTFVYSTSGEKTSRKG